MAELFGGAVHMLLPDGGREWGQSENEDGDRGAHAT